MSRPFKFCRRCAKPLETVEYEGMTRARCPDKACGFVRNNNPEVPKLTACGAKDNKTAYCSLSVSGEVSMTMSAASAITAKRNADGSLPPMK